MPPARPTRRQQPCPTTSSPTLPKGIRLRRRLDAELVRRGIASGRDDAKRLIGSGSITVDGSSIVKASTLVSETASIVLDDSPPRWASRAGDKLAHALDVFAVDATGSSSLDVGASTGGFTDVLLDRGAASVTAVDVGYGQLLWRLRQDPRVRVFDRTNFRTVDPNDLGGPFDLVVVDVSFISVSLIAANLARVGDPGADYVVLVKPQFEVGRDRVGRGGVVTDPMDHGDAIHSVILGLAAAEIGVADVTASPLTGAKGNREFLVHGVLGRVQTVSNDRISSVATS